MRRRDIFRENPKQNFGERWLFILGELWLFSWAAAYTAYCAYRKLNFQEFEISAMRRDFRLSSFIWNGPMETLPAVVV